MYRIMIGFYEWGNKIKQIERKEDIRLQNFVASVLPRKQTIDMNF